MLLNRLKNDKGGGIELRGRCHALFREGYDEIGILANLPMSVLLPEPADPVKPMVLALFVFLKIWRIILIESGSLLSTTVIALEIDRLSPFRIPATNSDTSDLARTLSIKSYFCGLLRRYRGTKLTKNFKARL